MKKIYLFITIIIILIFIIISYFDLIPKKIYYAKDFNIEEIKSKSDANSNGVDDYTDILLGARTYVETHPKYKSEYYNGGYPPKEIGVCTDVIWNAFKYAGYNLKEMIDNDIKNHVDDYPRVKGKPDPNIDFRRVPNINVFLKKYATSLSIDIKEIKEFQPGDILVYNDKHIAIVSDKRNKKGIPYIIHNDGSFKYEADVLNNRKLTGHYRFDANNIDNNILVYE